MSCRPLDRDLYRRLGWQYIVSATRNWELWYEVVVNGDHTRDTEVAALKRAWPDCEVTVTALQTTTRTHRDRH